VSHPVYRFIQLEVVIANWLRYYPNLNIIPEGIGIK